MELGLRMGEAPARRPLRAEKAAPLKRLSRLDLVLGIGRSEEGEEEKGKEEEVETEEKEEGEEKGSGEPPPQLNLEALLPAPPQRSSPALLRRRWATETRNSEASMRGLDVNRSPSAEERASSSSSPNSTVSCPQMDFSAQKGGGGGVGAAAAAVGRASSRVSDEEENGLVRKKLRLSKEQSDSLEESFKEHSTLNPKQKLALSEQLNLRPRQVEVWFQNRRARTKLKQTEVHCEYLNRCCQTLMEENRRLQKKVAELRALQTSCHDFSMHLPATTLSMCPSCERVAPTPTPTSNSASAAAASDHQPNSFSALIPKPRPSSLAVQPAPATSRQSSPAS